MMDLHAWHSLFKVSFRKEFCSSCFACFCDLLVCCFQRQTQWEGGTERQREREKKKKNKGTFLSLLRICLPFLSLSLWYSQQPHPFFLAIMFSSTRCAFLVILTRISTISSSSLFFFFVYDLLLRQQSSFCKNSLNFWDVCSADKKIWFFFRISWDWLICWSGCW